MITSLHNKHPLRSQCGHTLAVCRLEPIRSMWYKLTDYSVGCKQDLEDEKQT